MGCLWVSDKQSAHFQVPARIHHTAISAGLRNANFQDQREKFSNRYCFASPQAKLCPLKMTLSGFKQWEKHVVMVQLRQNCRRERFCLFDQFGFVGEIAGTPQRDIGGLEFLW